MADGDSGRRSSAAGRAKRELRGGRRSTAAVAPARRCAYVVIRRVFEQGAYADRALHGEAAGLDPRDRALAVQLSYGTIQRRATLDHVLQQLSNRPLSRLEPPVLAALRLGAFQLLFLSGVAAHAAVNESVELAKTHGSRGTPTVNAILRRLDREGSAILAGLDDRSPERAAVLHSVPLWLARRWWEELGSEQARALLARVNDPAESALRVNTLRTDRASALESLPVAARAAAELPEAVVLEAPFDAHGSALFAAGAIMPQSRGSMRVARALSPQPGQRVLDLCAAPGAKTTHLGALMRDSGELVAVEHNPGRARALVQTCERMGVSCARVSVADARTPPGSAFDRVLVDPPCSGLGTLQSRPDLRWRASEERIAELAALQAEILEAASAVVAAGGSLVYSVCTISRDEAESVVNGFLDRHRHWDAEPYLQLLPNLDGTDGFFIARLRRAPA